MSTDVSEQERNFRDLEALVMRMHAQSIATMQNMDLMQLKQIIDIARPDSARCVAAITIGELVEALAHLSSQEVANGDLRAAGDESSEAQSQLLTAPAGPDKDVLRNRIVGILDDTVNNKKPWWVLLQLEDAINTDPPGPTMAEKAKKYLLDWDLQGGFVLFWDIEPYAWKNEIRDPEAERPGVLAIGADGSSWVTRGGDDHNGAEKWVQIVDPTKRKTV